MLNLLKSFNTDYNTDFNMEIELNEKNQEIEQPTNTLSISEPYIDQLTSIKSSKIYEKWYQRYLQYAESRKISESDVTTFLNWICFLKDVDKYLPSTIITAASCANSRLKLKTQQNFMHHMLVKDLI